MTRKVMAKRCHPRVAEVEVTCPVNPKLKKIGFFDLLTLFVVWLGRDKHERKTRNFLKDTRKAISDLNEETYPQLVSFTYMASQTKQSK